MVRDLQKVEDFGHIIPIDLLALLVLHLVCDFDAKVDAAACSGVAWAPDLKLADLRLE
jgi:hypothetical protein